MFTLAVTGGLGAGKSTAARHLGALGAAVIDLDRVAKAVLDDVPGVRERLVERFGDDVVGGDGRIDTQALAAAAFGDATGAADLNDIVHPATIDAVRTLVSDVSHDDRAPEFVVLEIPLLAEAPQLLDDVDAVLAIRASEETRIARAVSRGMTESDARARIARQASDERRAGIADAVIMNDGGLADFRSALSAFYRDAILPRLARSR